MKIGIFTECYKPTINGVVMSIEAFKTRLEGKGHEVFIFAPKNKQVKFLPNVFYVPSITLPSPKDYPIGLPYLSYPLLFSSVSNLRLDIIHTQHIFLMGGVGQLLAKKLNIPTVHTYHTMMTEYTHYVPIKIFQGLIKKFIISRSRNFCNRADKIIVPSSPIIDILKSYGVKKLIEVLPTGIDLTNFNKLSSKERRTILKKYKIPAEKEVVLFVGRLAQEKNLDFLIECFKDIITTYQNVHLILVGSGPYQENLKSKIKSLKLENHITLTGFLERPQTNKLFGAADIFAFPSITDTQGIVLAESMASSTPVVAINQLGPKDIIKDGQDGFLVSLNKKEFSDKILRLLKDKKLRQKFSRQAKIDAKRFSIENCTDKLIKLYEETIENHKR
ncbi:MAG: glycosyltransferase family 4 protein [Candidatus Berkelbacteria bacterium]|nr:glycosyltransferase family 4 protein [Candidatus Berkelbacteria bacterium]